MTESKSAPQQPEAEIRGILGELARAIDAAYQALAEARKRAIADTDSTLALIESDEFVKAAADDPKLSARFAKLREAAKARSDALSAAETIDHTAAHRAEDAVTGLLALADGSAHT